MADSYNELFGLGSHSADASLEGWWPLQDDAANTTVADVSGKSRTGTLAGGDNTADLSTTGPNSYLAKGLNLDGANDYVATATFSLSEYPMTIAGFGNPADAAGIESLAFYGSTGYEHGVLLISNAAWAITQGASGNTQATGGSVSNSTWYHLAGVFVNATDREIFLNGTSVGTDTTSNTPDSMSSPVMNIGNRASAVQRWTGIVADVSIFSRELTTDEINNVRLGPEPVNSVAPAVSGTETEDETLSVTTGTWGLDSPFSGGTNGTITYSYQWTRSDDGTGTNEADIGSATSSTYTLVSADVGKYIRCRVRASNDGGYDADADTNSDFTGAIAAAASGNPVSVSIQKLLR